MFNLLSLAVVFLLLRLYIRVKSFGVEVCSGVQYLHEIRVEATSGLLCHHLLKPVSCCLCGIPWYRAFLRYPFIINISMYFGATEKWHVLIVMVSRVVQLAGASDAPSGTRVSNRPVCGVILVIADV